jgi:hypothetical protein
VERIGDEVLSWASILDPETRIPAREQRSARDRVWLSLHSGSRGVGNKLAQHHIDVARGYAARHRFPLPDPDLAYLVEGTPEFERHITEMQWAQRFALVNREEMMDRVVTEFERWAGVPASFPAPPPGSPSRTRYCEPRWRGSNSGTRRSSSTRSPWPTNRSTRSCGTPPTEIRHTRSIHIDAPVEKVFHYLEDPEHFIAAMLATIKREVEALA